VATVRTIKSRRLVAYVIALAAVLGRPLFGAAQDRALLPDTARWIVEISTRPSSPPVLGGAHVIVALQAGIVAAHRLSDGVQAWHVELRTEQPLAMDGNRVFVGSGEAIHALNAADGLVAWRAQSGTLTAPLLAYQGWIIAASEGYLAAYRAADGTQVWKQPSGPQRARATIEGNHLYVPLDNGRLQSLDLATGTLRWERRFRGTPGEVLAFADRVYVGSADKSLSCLDADDGEVEWLFRIGAPTRGRPAGDARRVYVTGMDNMVRAFDRADGAMLWHPSVPFRPTMGPVVVGSVVLVAGTGNEVRAFDAATGRPAATTRLDLPFATPPAFADVDGMTVMAALTGGLTEQWKLSLWEPGILTVPIGPVLELPGTGVPIGTAPPPIPIGPLTALPGTIVPIGQAPPKG